MGRRLVHVAILLCGSVGTAAGFNNGTRVSNLTSTTKPAIATTRMTPTSAIRKKPPDTTAGSKLISNPTSISPLTPASKQSGAKTVPKEAHWTKTDLPSFRSAIVCVGVILLLLMAYYCSRARATAAEGYSPQTSLYSNRLVPEYDAVSFPVDYSPSGRLPDIMEDLVQIVDEEAGPVGPRKSVVINYRHDTFYRL